MGKKIHPYSVARIRMLERTLLTEKDYIQMVDARSADDAMKILIDSGYGEFAIVQGRDFEKVLSDALSKTYSDVRELSTGSDFIKVFLYKNDYHNLKVMVKADISGIRGTDYLIEGGTVQTEVLKEAFASKNFSMMPFFMQEAVKEAYDAYGRMQSGQAVDIVLDKAAFKQMLQTANKSGIEFVKKYVEYVCDMTNIKNFLRIKTMKRPFDLFEDVFVEGGTLGLERFRTAFRAETPWNGLKDTQYGELCEEGMPKGFTVFERLCDNYIMKFIRSAKYKSLTIEPVAAYIYARETEVKTVRIIMSGKINNIEPDVIKERLRESYV